MRRHKQNIAAMLASHGPLTQAGLDLATSDVSAGCLVDCPHAHAPLLIAFGFVDWQSIAGFDFWGRSKKFEAHNGLPLNRVLLRDTASLWYQHGCAGMGHRAEDLSRALAVLVATLAPSKIMVVGQSMGGYAALQFGTDLQRRFGNVRMLAFGPLSHLCPQRARQEGDLRYLPMMECLAITRPRGFVPDLVQYMQQAADDGVTLQCGIVVGAAQQPPQGDNSDHLHAARFAALPGVQIDSFPDAPHAVVQWLIDQGRIDDVFQTGANDLIAPGPRVSYSVEEPGITQNFESRCASDGALWVVAQASGFTPPTPITDPWKQWLAENLLLGCTRLDTIYTLVKNGFDAAQACSEIVAILASPAMVASKRLSSRLDKRDWMLSVQRSNRELDVRNHAISVMPALDRETFLREHYSRNRPVVMTGAFDDWPARKKWSLDYINQTCGHTEVQVQTDRESDSLYEIRAHQHRRLMRLSDCLKLIADTDKSGGTSNNLYITAGNTGVNECALQALWPDTRPTLPAYLDSQLPGRNGFFWMGPRGTVTPLHHDLTNNFMAQVVGRKRVWLIDPAYTPLLANQLHCFSEVDLRNIDFERFPLMRKVRVLEHVLSPGELLFLPIGWWHQVVGIDTTITMTYTNFLWPNDYASDYRTYGPV